MSMLTTTASGKATWERERTSQERLNQLIDQIVKGMVSGDEVERELLALLCMFDNVYYREKIRQAIDWAEIYFSPRKSNRYGGPEKVRRLLLIALTTAAREGGHLHDVTH